MMNVLKYSAGISFAIIILSLGILLVIKTNQAISVQMMTNFFVISSYGLWGLLCIAIGGFLVFVGFYTSSKFLNNYTEINSKGYVGVAEAYNKAPQKMNFTLNNRDNNELNNSKDVKQLGINGNVLDEIYKLNKERESIILGEEH